MTREVDTDDRVASPAATVSTVQLLFLSALSPLSLHILIPALPAIQTEFAVSAATVQSLVSLSSVGIAIAVLIYGPLADRFGRRPVLIAAGTLFVIGSALGALAPAVLAVIGGRVLQAVGGASGLVLARAICRDIYPADKAMQLIAYLMLSTAATPLVAPFVGGLVTDTIGWRWLFVLSGLFGVVLVGWIITGLRETLREPLPLPGLTGIFGPYASLLRMRRFRRYTLVLAFASAFFFAFMSAAPFLFVQVLGGSASAYGAWGALVLGCFIIGSLLVAQGAKSFGTDRLIVVGASIFVTAAATAAWWLSAPDWAALDLFGPASVMGIGAGLVISSAMSGAVSMDPKRAGSASGFSTFVQFLFGAVAVTSLGFFPAGRPDALVAVMLVCAVGCFGVAMDLVLRRG
jgi:DHA1 family bicyclomycin/chloramphenicol resistance-like MFS transporter